MWIRRSSKAPTKPAIIDENNIISYRELENQINCIGATLQTYYQHDEARVGILLSRHHLMISAILATLKSGAAYVPLDPNYPKERLAYICKDANITALISEENHKALATIIYDGPIVDVHEVIKTQEQEFKPVEYTANQLAYIIYTSGSTGKPKGVAIEHRSAVSLVDWAVTQFSKLELAGTLASTSICFDLSIFEIFVPLSIGTSVIVADNLFHLADHPARNKVSLINTVPTAAAELLRINALPSSVKTVNLAGEAVPHSLIDDLYEKSTVQSVYNLYGPSEDTTYSSYCLLEKNQSYLKDCAIPIGQVISNSQAYILDEHYQAVAIGMIGELYLAGDGLARGYWQQEAMTNERFIILDHLEKAPIRVYKTGDKVRRRADGNIEFLGRIDHQVKLRGFRIELNEIDALLLEHPQVIQSATIVKEQYLSAYIVAHSSVNIKDQHNMLQLYDALNNHLKLSLPEYMLPKEFYVLEKLPLLPNGKINRKNLDSSIIIKHLKAQAFETKEINQQSLNAMEYKIAMQWEKVLGHAPKYSNDNFFKLGGDSIQAIQLVAALREDNIQFMPRDIFLYATLSEQAKIAENRPLISIDQTPIEGLAPLLPVQSWFFDQAFNHAEQWNQSILFNCKHKLNTELLKKSLIILAKQHDALRASFTYQDNQWQQHITNIENFDLPFKQQKKTVKNSKLFIQENNQQCQESFRFDGSPLWQCQYYEITDKHGTAYRLLLTMHHLIIDGVSWRILLNDLQLIYLSLFNNPTINATLPSKSTSIKKWGHYLIDNSQAIYHQEYTYWQTIAEKPYQLPIAKPSNCINEQYSKISGELNKQLTEKLLKEVPQSFAVHINDLLLSALLYAIAQWTGNYELKLQLESHGRTDLNNDVDLSRTIAWLTAIYPVYLSSSNDDISDNIKAIKQQLRAIPNDGIGYGIIRYLHGNSILSNGLVNAPVRFNYLGQTDQTISQNALFTIADEDIGETQHKKEKNDVLIDISSMIKNDQFIVHWQYHKNIDESIMTMINNAFISRLTAMIEYCLEHESNSSLIAADFPEMNFSDGELDDILSNL